MDLETQADRKHFHCFLVVEFWTFSIVVMAVTYHGSGAESLLWEPSSSVSESRPHAEEIAQEEPKMCQKDGQRNVASPHEYQWILA